jgi:hypothetical protein
MGFLSLPSAGVWKTLRVLNVDTSPLANWGRVFKTTRS